LSPRRSRDARRCEVEAIAQPAATARPEIAPLAAAPTEGLALLLGPIEREHLPGAAQPQSMSADVVRCALMPRDPLDAVTERRGRRVSTQQIRAEDTDAHG